MRKDVNYAKYEVIAIRTKIAQQSVKGSGAEVTNSPGLGYLSLIQICTNKSYLKLH